MKISIIIPAYNEAMRIFPTLFSYNKYFLEKYNTDFEIIVVLNGCKDNTKEIVKEFQKQAKNVFLIDIPQPIGKGGAIAQGLEIARGDLICYTDADGSTRSEILDKLIIFLAENLEFACAIGSRNVAGAVVKNKPRIRNLLSKGFNFWTNLLFNLGIQDTQCGAKVIRKTIVHKIIPNLQISNMAFDVNFLVEIKRINSKIKEIPIEWEDNLDSKVGNKLKTSTVMGLSVFRLWFMYSPFKKLYFLFRPFSYFLWKILLTQQERKYRKIDIKYHTLE